MVYYLIKKYLKLQLLGLVIDRVVYSVGGKLPVFASFVYVPFPIELTHDLIVVCYGFAVNS